MLQGPGDQPGRGRHALDLPAGRALQRQLVQRRRRRRPVQEPARWRGAAPTSMVIPPLMSLSVLKGPTSLSPCCTALVNSSATSHVVVSRSALDEPATMQSML